MMGANGKRIKLVVCDIDGTLVGPNDYGISIGKQALDFCKKRGVRVTAATGRAFGAAQRHLEYLGIDEPAITNGGALIAKFVEPPLYEKTIDQELAQNIVFDLEKLGHPFYLMLGKHIYTCFRGSETQKYSNALGYKIIVLDSLKQIPLVPTQIVLRVSAEKADEIIDVLCAKKWPGVWVQKSLPHLLEIRPTGVSKASALAFLSKSMGIIKEEVLSIGDQLNDLDMLLWAGKNAAVNNAHYLVKDSVAYVSPYSYGEGVLDIVRKFIR